MKIRLVALALMVCGLASNPVAVAQMPGPPISGTVFSQRQGPVGGITISLVHPQIGRSTPAISAPNGAYFFGNVPPRPDPYYLEAYWGNQLLYRGAVTYQGGSVFFNIPLP